MTKEDLVDVLAEKTGILKKQARSVLVALPEIILEGIKRNGKVTLTGLGKFTVANRAARTGRNPQDGSAIIIAARATLKFIPSRENRTL